MADLKDWTAMTLGFVLIASGLGLLIFRGHDTATRVKALGMEFDNVKTGLLVLLLGSGIFALPFILGPETPEHSGRTGTTRATLAEPMSVGPLAHEIRFFRDRAPIETDACVERGKEALRRSRMTGVGATTDLAYGYNREYTAAVWCLTDKELVIYLVSGPRAKAGDDLLGNLKRGF